MAVTKMTVEGFSKSDYSSSAGKFTVMLNPESLQVNHQIQYSDRQSAGSIGPEMKFDKMPPRTLTCKLTFDGTGVVADMPQDWKGKTVMQQITAFRKIVFDYNSESHRPNWLVLTWGTVQFKGVLTSLNISYKLFQSDGTPLRAELDMSCASSISAADEAAEKQKKSPDLTRVWQVKAGDNLPGMCEKAYDGVNYYVQVAQANRLNRLRGLRVGESITIPPLR